MAEKTEKATPKKIRDSRKKGQVAKSQDFPAAFTFVVSLTGVIILAKSIYNELSSYMITIFNDIGKNVDLTNKAGGYILNAIQVIFNTSVPLMILVSLVGVVVNFLIIGPLFSLEALKPDIKRLNPVDNIKNMFKFKTLFELLKSIFKIAGALILIYSVVWNSLPEIIATAAMPILGTTMVFSDFLVKVAIRVGIFFLVIAVFDLIFQKKNFAKEMKMEKFEVKQEHKDTEGDPHIKGKRRQAAHEIAYQEGPSSTKRAKTVITNPTHLAIALEYDAEKDPAPKILTMGKDIVADQIVKVAIEYKIPIMRNVPLAHELWGMGKISEYIPEATYPAVAEILRWLAQIEQAEDFNKDLFQ